jgi:hypothetical protein
VRRKEEEFAKWKNIFEECAVEFMDDFYTETDRLKVKIDKEMKHVDPEIRSKLF